MINILIKDLKGLLAAVLTCLVPFLSVKADPCEPFLRPPELSLRQQKVLEKAATSSDYSLRLFQGVVGGRPRLVILLGEDHYKSPESYRLGQAIVRSFNHRGLEGMDLSTFKLQKVWPTLQENIARPAALPPSWKGSTIDFAEHEPHLAQMAEQISLLLQTQFHGQPNFKRQIEKELKQLRDNPHLDKSATVIGQQLTQWGWDPSLLDEMDLDDMLSKMKGNIQDPKFPSPIYNFFLEQNHRPDWLEELAVLGVAIKHHFQTLKKPLPAATVVSASGLGLILPPPAPLIGLVALASYGALLSGFPLPPFLSQFLGLFNRKRDFDMAQQITSLFAQHPGMDTLLTLVGKGHVNNLARHLRRKGFTEKTSHLEPLQNHPPASRHTPATQ